MTMNSNLELIRKLKQDVLKSRELEKALLKVPREFFVPEKYKGEAYGNFSFPIGHEQSICKPSDVALMSELLDIKRGHKVLEIGTGSGWHTCLLSHMVGMKGKVFTIEIFEDLIDKARKNITKFGLDNITIVHGDGTLGLRYHGPYDRIIITSAAPDIPYPLKQQLRDGGKIVVPVGNIFTQQMIQYEKKGLELEEGKTEGYFKFDPLQGRYGFKIWW